MFPKTSDRRSCGAAGTAAREGLIGCLWKIFGGTVNAKGFRELDPHIGAIYGDSITEQRAQEICQRLEAKGFASTNVVLGIGSFTYQYVTRDTFGFAIKATWARVNGRRARALQGSGHRQRRKEICARHARHRQNNKGAIEMRDGLNETARRAETNDLLVPVWREGNCCSARRSSRFVRG